MGSNHIPDSTKQSLSKQLEKLNPFLLRKSIEAKLKQIFAL
jgi:hypothetical protein